MEWKWNSYDPSTQTALIHVLETKLLKDLNPKAFAAVMIGCVGMEFSWKESPILYDQVMKKVQEFYSDPQHVAGTAREFANILYGLAKSGITETDLPPIVSAALLNGLNTFRSTFNVIEADQIQFSLLRMYWYDQHPVPGKEVKGNQQGSSEKNPRDIPGSTQDNQNQSKNDNSNNKKNNKKKRMDKDKDHGKAEDQETEK
jgi:hypothetical protein